MEPLPPELFYHIAEYASPDTICNLRLLSRAVEAAVEAAFLDVYFRERRYLHTSYAMRNLARVCAHPRLRKRLEQIVICFSEPGFRSCAKFSHLRAHSLPICECDRLLVASLQSLQAASVRPELQFRSLPSDHCDQPYGTEERRLALWYCERDISSPSPLDDKPPRDWRPDPADFTRRSTAVVVDFGLAVMAQAGYRPLKLDLGGWDFEDFTISPASFELGYSDMGKEWFPTPIDLDAAFGLWSELTSLTIAIDEGHFLTTRNAQPIAPWLEAAVRLKKLRICFPWEEYNRWHLQRPNCELFNKWLRKARLEELWLDRVWFSEAGFITLLTQHAPTLTSLVAMDLRFAVGTDCARIFRWMAASLQLRKLDLYKPLYDGEPLFDHLLEENGDKSAVRTALEVAAERFERLFSGNVV